jgi:hypothetical protein
MFLNFSFATAFKNKTATGQEFLCVSTANGTITEFDCALLHIATLIGVLCLHLK